MRRLYIPLFVLFLLLGAVLLATTAGYAASVTVRVESVQAASGEEAEIPITVEGAPGIGAMHLELTYDAAILEAKTVDKGPLLTDNALLDFNAAEPGRLVIGFVTLDAIQGDGTLLVTRFVVNGQEGQTSPLHLENVRAWEGETRLDILVTTEAGEFTVSAAGLPLPLPLLLAALAFVLFVVLFVLLLVAAILRRRPQPALVERPPQPQPSQPPRVGYIFCSQCGTELEASNRFCTNCGHRLSG